MITKPNFEINTFISREERHYCAYIYSCLLESRKNVEILLPEGCELGKEYRLFYENTAIREYLYNLKQKVSKNEYESEKDSLNMMLVQNTKLESADIQKKKIDLAIQTQINGKTMFI